MSLYVVRSPELPVPAAATSWAVEVKDLYILSGRITHSSSEQQSTSQPHQVGPCQQQQCLSNAYEDHAADECLYAHQRELASEHEMVASPGATWLNYRVRRRYSRNRAYNPASQLFGPVLQMRDAHATA